MDNFIINAASSFCNYRPGCFHFKGNPSFENLIWETSEFEKPSEEVFNQKVFDLKNEFDRLEYQRLRALEYPDFKDYLDGIVKGDQEQIEAYRLACLAVKEKYPKPE